MAANTSPIYSRLPDLQWVDGYIVTANTTADLTAGTIYLAFTADATNGSFLQKLVFRATPAGNTTKTVARIWLNNGSTTGTASNNVLVDEVALPLVTADADDPTYGIHWILNQQIPAGYRVYVTIHTGSANGWACTAYGGKY
jgi:hypothetical protein